MRRGYDHLLSVALRRRAIAYIAVGAIAIAGIAAVPFLNHSSLPQFKETELLIEWNGAPGTSLPESARITAQATSELRQIPGVRSVQAQVGRAITGDRVASVDSSELWVSIDPDADYEATVRAVDELAASYPGFETRVVTYSNARVQEVLDDTSEDLTVRVFGVALDYVGRDSQRRVGARRRYGGRCRGTTRSAGRGANR